MMLFLIKDQYDKLTKPTISILKKFRPPLANYKQRQQYICKINEYAVVIERAIKNKIIKL